MMERYMNKKGAMSLELVVASVILIIILVVVGLTVTGQIDIFNRFNPFAGGSTVESVINGCNIACSGGAQDDYCRVTRNVRFEKGGKTAKVTCMYMENEGRRQISGVAIASARNIPLPGFSQFTDIGVCDNVNRVTCVPSSLETLSRSDVVSANAKFNGVPDPTLVGQQLPGDQVPPSDPTS